MNIDARTIRVRNFEAMGRFLVHSPSTFEKPVTVLDTTNSTSPTTGSVTTSGGLGVLHDLQVGQGITVNGTTDATVSTGALAVAGGVSINKSLFVGQDLNVSRLLRLFPSSGSTASVGLKALVGTQSYTLAFPSAAPSGPSLLQVDADGQLSFVTSTALASNKLELHASTASSTNMTVWQEKCRLVIAGNATSYTKLHVSLHYGISVPRGIAHIRLVQDGVAIYEYTLQYPLGNTWEYFEADLVVSPSSEDIILEYCVANPSTTLSLRSVILTLSNDA
jgi:hypothetical protein